MAGINIFGKPVEQRKEDQPGKKEEGRREKGAGEKLGRRNRTEKSRGHEIAG